MRLHVNFSVPSSFLRRKDTVIPQECPRSIPALGPGGPGLAEEAQDDVCASCRHEKYPLVISGKFVFKPYKTSEPETKLVHHLGMIAGGTGKRELGASSRVNPETSLTLESWSWKRRWKRFFPWLFEMGIQNQ